MKLMRIPIKQSHLQNKLFLPTNETIPLLKRIKS